MADPLEISALTLNCWGLKYISTLRTERLAEIGRRIAALASSSPSSPSSSSSSSPAASVPLSIVALQECWCYEDFSAIHELTRHELPYAKFFRAGVWGAGLAVLSRWPITSTSMSPYLLNGRPTAFWRGDWFVGKGLASATVRVSETTTLEVLVTHTHAPYEGGQPDDSYLLHQIAQTWEAGKRIRAAAERGRLVLAMGDWNMTPDSLPYQSLYLGAGASGDASSPFSFVLHDAWRDLHPNAALGNSYNPLEQARQQWLNPQGQQTIPTAAFNLAENGTASDNVLNTWRWSKDKQKRLHKSYAQRSQRATSGNEIDSEFVIAPDTPDPAAKRLDYVFYAAPCPPASSSSSASASASSAWRTKTARVAMTEPHPTLGCSVSDHYAVAVTLTREPASVSAGTTRAENAGVPTFFPSTYDSFLAESDRYMAREQKQRYWRSVHFFVSVAVTIGCYVAVWFSPRNFVAFLLTLLASLGLATGVVDGLIALLFFGSEIRYIKDFEWEIRNAKAAASSVRAPSSHVEDK